MPLTDAEREAFAAEEREFRARYRAARPERLACPLCPAIRTTPETLRVHGWLAHAIRTPPRGA